MYAIRLYAEISFVIFDTKNGLSATVGIFKSLLPFPCLSIRRHNVYLS